MLDYTKISFEDLVDQLINVLKTKDAWKDANLQSTGRTLIELYAYTAQLLLYYLKRSFEELFVDSSQYWESLCKIANMIEAPVKRPVGASGKVKLVLNQQSNQPIIVPAKTQISCDGVLFYTVHDVVFNSGETQKEVIVRQGTWLEKSFVSDGNQLTQNYKIAGENVSDLDVEVYAGNMVYSVVSYFGQVLDQLQVKVWTSPDKALNVSFLKGFGTPNYGVEIKVRYSEVTSDYFPAVRSQWSVVSDNRFQVVADLSTFSRGAGWEDIEGFRQRLQGWYGVGQRLNSKDDFELAVKSVAGVKFVQVVSVMANFEAPFRAVEIYITDEEGKEPSQDIMNRVEGWLGRLGGVGVMYLLRPVQLVKIPVYVRIYTSRMYDVHAIQSQAVNIIKSLYGGLGIQEWLPVMRLRDKLLAIVGVRDVVVVQPHVDLSLKKGQRLWVENIRVDILV